MKGESHTILVTGFPAPKAAISKAGSLDFGRELSLYTFPRPAQPRLNPTFWSNDCRTPHPSRIGVDPRRVAGSLAGRERSGAFRRIRQQNPMLLTGHKGPEFFRAVGRQPRVDRGLAPRGGSDWCARSHGNSNPLPSISVLDGERENRIPSAVPGLRGGAGGRSSFGVPRGHAVSYPHGQEARDS